MIELFPMPENDTRQFIHFKIKCRCFLDAKQATHMFHFCNLQICVVSVILSK